MSPGLPLSIAGKLANRAARFAAFEQFARFMPDSPQASCYHIRVGSKLLTSDDTYTLREKFDAEVKRLRRKQAA